MPVPHHNGPWHHIHGQQANLGYGLNNPGFIIGQHDRNQNLLARLGCVSEHRFKCGQINHAICINRDAFGIRSCLDHRRMFDRTGKYGDILKTIQRKVVGLCPAASKDDPFGITAQQIGNGASCMINNLAGRTATCMNRRRITCNIHRRKHGLLCITAKRCAGVVVEVNLIGHQFKIILICICP